MNHTINNSRLFLITILFGLSILFSCIADKTGTVFERNKDIYSFKGVKIKLEIDNSTRIKIYMKIEDEWLSMTSKGKTTHYLIINSKVIKQFIINDKKTELPKNNNNYGLGFTYSFWKKGAKRA